jgi:hypothetical protein
MRVEIYISSFSLVQPFSEQAKYAFRQATAKYLEDPQISLCNKRWGRIEVAVTVLT